MEGARLAAVQEEARCASAHPQRRAVAAGSADARLDCFPTDPPAPERESAVVYQEGGVRYAPIGDPNLDMARRAGDWDHDATDQVAKATCEASPDG